MARNELPTTDERRQIYVDAIRETGSLKEAGRRASPHAKAPSYGSSTWHDLRRRDPEFEAQVQQAISDFVGKAEAALTERAFEPETREHYSRDGQLISRETSHRESNKLLLRLLSRHDPEWREKTSLNVSGSVSHTTFTLNPTLIMQLPRERAELLIELLDELSAIEQAQDQGLDPRRAVGNGP
jgi:hypothetical protein